jgi:SAM-dependent methyltransferase
MPALSKILYQLRRATLWMAGNVRERGALTTLQVAWSVVEDAWFDRRFGTETARTVYTDQLESHLANRDHSTRHKATKARPLQTLLRELPLPAGSTFVDIGCGKGKVLLLAAQHPFARVVGIEFSPSLCEQARRNIEIFRRQVRLRAPVEVIEADVTQHVFGGDENVFFLYNPFDGEILEAFLKNLAGSLASHPRELWMIYNAPAYAGVVDASGLFRPGETRSIGGNEFRVYWSGAAATSG